MNQLSDSVNVKPISAQLARIPYVKLLHTSVPIKDMTLSEFKKMIISDIGYIFVRKSTTEFTVNWNEDMIIPTKDPLVYLDAECEKIKGKRYTGNNIIHWIFSLTNAKDISEMYMDAQHGPKSCLVGSTDRLYYVMKDLYPDFVLTGNIRDVSEKDLKTLFDLGIIDTLEHGHVEEKATYVV